MAREPDAEAIRLDIPVVSDMARYLDLLAVPAYAALAMENNGLGVSLSSRLVLTGRDSFQIKAGVIKFVGKNGLIYKYEVSARFSVGVAESRLVVPVEVDTSNVLRGSLQVRMYPPMSTLIPREWVDRIEFKVRSVADISSQKKMVAYLDRLAKEPASKARGQEGMLELIAFEAYNNSGPAARIGPDSGDAGKAEPLADQRLLILTLAIWIIGLPIFLWIVRSRRRLQARV